MDFQATFKQVFVNGMENYSRRNQLSDEDIEDAVRNVQHAHQIEQLRRGAPSRLDYDIPAYACAYLHKYAAVHAGLTRYLLQPQGTNDYMQSYRECYVNDIREMLLNAEEDVKICCLGGGPGVDAIALSAAMHTMPESVGKTFKFTTIDKFGWGPVYESIMERTDGNADEEGTLQNFLQNQVEHTFVTADLLNPWGEDLKNKVRTADFLTMIRFLSALQNSSGRYDERVHNMLKKVFKWMKPGARFVFIDNGVYPVLQPVLTAAESANCLTKVCDEQYMEIHNEHIDLATKFGVRDLATVKVYVVMWRKSDNSAD